MFPSQAFFRACKSMHACFSFFLENPRGGFYFLNIEKFALALAALVPVIFFVKAVSPTNGEKRGNRRFLRFSKGRRNLEKTCRRKWPVKAFVDIRKVEPLSWGSLVVSADCHPVFSGSPGASVGATRMPPRGAARRLHHIRLEHVC